MKKLALLTFHDTTNFGKRVLKKDWVSMTLNDLEKRSESYTLGGMCFQYNDRNMFETNYYIFDCDGISFDDGTKAISETTTSTNYSAFRKSIEPCVTTKDISISDGTYVGFMNPTELLNFTFNEYNDNNKGFDSASADNWRHESNDLGKSYASIIDAATKNVSYTSDHYLMTSVQIAFSNTFMMPRKVFRFIHDSIMNWTIKLPIIDYSSDSMKVAATNNMYPISKINTITYGEGSYCFYDMFQ